MGNPSLRPQRLPRDVRPSPHLRRLFATGFATVACVFFMVFWLMPMRVDFLNLYSAGKAALVGHVSSIYDTQAFWRIQQSIIPWPEIVPGMPPRVDNASYVFLYLPVYAYLLALLALVPYVTSRLLFGLASILCLAGTIHFGRRLSGMDWASSALVVLFCGPAYHALGLGQLSPFLLLGATLISLRELQNRDKFGTGAITGLFMVKPQLLLPVGLVWLVRRRWRSLAGMAGMGIAAVFGSYLASPAAFLAYLRTDARHVATEVSYGTLLHLNGSAYGMLAQALPAPFSAWAAATLGAGALLALALAFRHSPTRYGYAALWAAWPLVTPWLGIYDSLILVAALWLLSPMWREDRLLFASCALLWVGEGLAVFTPYRGLAVVADTALFAYCVWQASRPAHGLDRSTLEVSKHESANFISANTDTRGP